MALVAPSLSRCIHCLLVTPRRAGFFVNRSLAPWAAEALLLVQGGVDPVALDKAVKAFGYPVGPGACEPVEGRGMR